MTRLSPFCVCIRFLLTLLSFLSSAYLLLIWRYIREDIVEPDWLSASAQSFSGSIFLVLVLVLGYYAVKVFYQVRKGIIAVCTLQGGCQEA